MLLLYVDSIYTWWSQKRHSHVSKVRLQAWWIHSLQNGSHLAEKEKTPTNAAQLHQRLTEKCLRSSLSVLVIWHEGPEYNYNLEKWEYKGDPRDLVMHEFVPGRRPTSRKEISEERLRYGLIIKPFNFELLSILYHKLPGTSDTNFCEWLIVQVSCVGREWFVINNTLNANKTKYVDSPIDF